MAKVMIHPASYENVQTAVEQAFELFPLDFTEKKVLLNPNVLRGVERRRRCGDPSGRIAGGGGEG